MNNYKDLAVVGGYYFEAIETTTALIKFIDSL